MTDAVGGFVKGAVDFVMHGLHHQVVLLVLGYCKRREMGSRGRAVSPSPHIHLIDQAAVLRYIPGGQGAQCSERTLRTWDVSQHGRLKFGVIDEALPARVDPVKDLLGVFRLVGAVLPPVRHPCPRSRSPTCEKVAQWEAGSSHAIAGPLDLELLFNVSCVWSIPLSCCW